MGKIKEIIKKHDNIFMLIIILILISVYSFFFSIGIIDEICNIGNLYKIYNGGKIYNDCNAVATPLFFNIGILFFRFLGANYFVFRFYNFLIFAMLLFISYILLKQLKLSKKYCMLSIILIAIIFNLYKIESIYQGAGYNYLAVVFYLLGITTKIKFKDKKVDALIQGIITFLIFYTKQNIGLFYMAATLLLSIIQFVKNKDKKVIYNILLQFSVWMVLTALSLLFMHFEGNLEQFINYTILGIGEFGNKNIKYIVVPTMGILIFFALYLRKIIIEKDIINQSEKEILTYASIYGVSLSLGTYPIMDMHHLLMYFYIIILLQLYGFFKIFEKSAKKTKTKTAIIDGLMILIVLFYTAKSCINNINYYNYFVREKTIYYGAIITENQKNKIENICSYIQKKKERKIDVIIVSYRAMIYTSRLKINNGDFDIPFYGNVGKEGVQGLLDKLSNMKNAEILITKDEKERCYQEPIELREYIVNNFEKAGEIEEFYIYKTNIYQEE